MKDASETQSSLNQSHFLKACRLEKTAITPVWLMRQAGRYMKDYREVRKKNSFLDLCKNKELVAEVTVTAQEKIKADAAIIFSDILLILEPMGLELSYEKGDGPKIANPIRTAHDFESLKPVHAQDSLRYVLEAISLTRRSLKPNIPLIGFSGAPFTMASYMIEGGATKTFLNTRQMMSRDSGLWKQFLTKIADETAKYLNLQIEAGCQAVQIFDSWAGILTPEEYEMWVLPYSKRLISQVNQKAPIIYFGTKTGRFLEKIASAGSAVVGVDSDISLSEAWDKIGRDKAIQGNMDPKILLGSLSEIKKEAIRILSEVRERPGYIFNLGHGVLPETPEENVIALIEIVHEISAQEHKRTS